MSFLTRKESLISNITFMALMAAINVIFVVLTYFIPLSFIFMVLFLPLPSMLTALLCKKRYLLIYVVSTTLICILVTLSNFSDTLFYVVPSIISGIIFGYLVEKKMPLLWGIFLSTLINFGFTYLSIPLIKLIFNEDILLVTSTILGIKDYAYLNYVIPVFVLTISLMQSFFSYLIIKIESKNLHLELVENSINIFIPLTALFMYVMNIIFVFVYPSFSYVFTLLGLYLSFYIFLYFILNKNKLMIILFLVSFVILTILFFVLYSQIAQPFALALFSLINLITPLLYFINNIKK